MKNPKTIWPTKEAVIKYRLDPFYPLILNANKDIYKQVHFYSCGVCISDLEYQDNKELFTL